MRKWKYIVLAGALLMMPIEAHASKKFSDVPPNHYAVEAIEWAEQEGIVSGVKGKFNPSKPVTEEQFVKMYAEFFGHQLNNTANQELSVWSKRYYDGLALYNVPLKGASNPSVRTKSITRGEVAQLIAFAHGKPSDIESAVQYMMEMGFSTGQNKEATSVLAQYGASNTLTRAQAVAFLYRIHLISGNTLVSTLGEQEEAIKEITIVTDTVKTYEPVDSTPTVQLLEANDIVRSYYLGGEVTGNVISEKDFELKFTNERKEIIGGYLAGLGKSLEDVTVGAPYHDELKFEQNGKFIEVLVDEFDGAKVLGIYWSYTDSAAKNSISTMEKDTSAKKQADEEKLYVDLFNETRKLHNLPIVTINETVMRVARDHSTDMYEKGYFSHTSLNGDSPGDRLAREGLIAYKTWGENISKGYRTVFHAHNGWMNSEGHRRNILNDAFEEIGVGVDNRLYTTVFYTGR